MGPVLTLTTVFVGMDTDGLYVSFAFHSNLIVLLRKHRGRTRLF